MNIFFPQSLPFYHTMSVLAANDCLHKQDDPRISTGILAGVRNKCILIRSGHREIDEKTVKRSSHLFVSLSCFKCGSSLHLLSNHSGVKIFDFSLKIRELASLRAIFDDHPMSYSVILAYKPTAVWLQQHCDSITVANELEMKEKPWRKYSI